MEFIIKSAVTLALLYSLFYFFLKKETFHKFNRVCLLFTLVASLVLPLVHINVSHPTAVNQAVIASTEYVTTLPTIVVTAETKAPLLTWNDVLAGIYWTGLCIMLLYLVLQIIQTCMLIKGGLRHTDKYGNHPKGGHKVALQYLPLYSNECRGLRESSTQHTYPRAGTHSYVSQLRPLAPAGSESAAMVQSLCVVPGERSKGATRISGRRGRH